MHRHNQMLCLVVVVVVDFSPADCLQVPVSPPPPPKILRHSKCPPVGRKGEVQKEKGGLFKYIQGKVVEIKKKNIKCKEAAKTVREAEIKRSVGINADSMAMKL